MIKGVKWILTRTWMIYLLAFGALGVLFDGPQVTKKVQAKILNRFRPQNVQYLVAFSMGKQPLDRKLMERYAFYYQKVTQYIPDRADAYGVLGYCYYALGETSKAITAYQQAIAINPDFFWFHYNLGMIYFQDGRYKQAYEALKKTVKTNPRDVIAYIQWSKRIYLPLILSKMKTKDYTVERELKNAYQQCYQLLAMLQQYFFNRPEFKDIFDRKEVSLALF